MFKRVLRWSFWLVAAIPATSALVGLALLHRLRPRRSAAYVMFGVDPIINNKYWAQCVPAAETWVCETYPINDPSDFDVVLDRRWPRLPAAMRYLLASAISLIRFDVFVLSYNGGFLGRTPLALVEPALFKLAGSKVIVLAFGSDSYVYRNVHSTTALHALLLSYPDQARNQHAVARRVERWNRHADVVAQGVMTLDGFGRWDMLLPSVLFIDQSHWQPSQKKSAADGSDPLNPVIVTHSPNHRGFKGTEFVTDAVQHLAAEGLAVELRLIEGMKNEDVRHILATQSDIHVEQLIATGHGLNGLEAMASGLPTICNLEDDPEFVTLMSRWSYLGECPIVSASPETVVDTLRRLVVSPDLRNELGIAGVDYVSERHSINAGTTVFAGLILAAYNRNSNLIKFFEPRRSHENPFDGRHRSQLGSR